MRRKSVGDLMSTALLYLHERDSLEQAHLSMRAAGVRHIPVVDSGRRVVGILSDRDILRAMAEDTLDRPVSAAMTREVRTVRPDTPAHEAARVLLEHKIGSLPVVGDDEQLVGIITETDFLRVACEALGGAAALY
jgi:CBS domain-containing protein